ncbi:MAG: DUF4271 domain-containing protein [Muribaculaceae bacterium]
MPTPKQNISHTTTAAATAAKPSKSSLAPHKAAADSIDTVAAVAPKYEPRFTKAFPDSSGNSVKILHPEQARVMTVPGEATAATPRHISPLYDNGSMLLVLAVIFITTVSYRKGYKYVADFFHNISSVRERQNLFEDHTVKETQIMTALTANTCIFEAILLYIAYGLLYHPATPAATPVFGFVAALTGLTVLFHLAMLALCWMLGFIFSDKLSTGLWLDGVKASASMLGVTLAPITFAILIFPHFVRTGLILAIIFYILARIVVIYKAFRIFFNNLQSLLYFILYLCSVEIVPVVLSFAGAMNLCGILHVGL